MVISGNYLSSAPLQSPFTISPSPIRFALMDFINAGHKNHLRRKLKLLAVKETDDVLRKLRKVYPQLKPMSVVYEDVPTTDMLKCGIKIESESAYDNDKQELTLFLFNIYE